MKSDISRRTFFSTAVAGTLSAASSRGVPGANERIRLGIIGSGSRKSPNAGVVAGHYSSMACHIANIAYKYQTRVQWQKEWSL